MPDSEDGAEVEQPKKIQETFLPDKSKKSNWKTWSAGYDPDNPSTPLEGRNIMHMLNNFVDHTGITLVSYVGTRNSIIWKSIWLLVIAAGFTMTIIQSNDAITDYFGYAITLRTTFELNGTMQFPAVSVCTNSPINWTHERNFNTTIYNEVMTKLFDENAKAIYSKESTRKSKSYEEFVLLDVMSRYYNEVTTASNLSNFGVLTKLYWNGETYTNKKGSQSKSFKSLEEEKVLYQTRDFLYGVCVVFNAEIDLAKSLSAAALTGAEFTLSWDIHDRYPYINDPSAVIVVHPVGTPPILDDSNNVKVNPGDEVSVAIRQREISRLPPPFPSRCVDRTNIRLQANSVYFLPERAYLFSMEACIKTCMQKISLDSCRCWDAQIPLGFLKRKYKRPLCKIDRCPQIDKKLTSKFCGCKLPCRETLLESTLTIKSGFIKEMAKRQQSNETEGESVELTSQQQQLQNQAKVKVFIKTAVYESIKEEPKYTVADFWGIIGGNAGLWIGISAVSLFEVIELVFVIVKSKISRLLYRRQGVQVLDGRELALEALRQIENNAAARDTILRNLRTRTYKFLPDF